MRSSLLILLLLPLLARAADVQVVDLPTRPDVTQRFLYLPVDKPAAAVILFAGGSGGLQLKDNGAMRWGAGNFLVRTRERFAAAGLAVAVIDAASDRNSGMSPAQRESAAHVTDVKAVIAWMKKLGKPVWLIGTSRGTQSVAYVASMLPPAEGGADGIVLTSTLTEDRMAWAVPELALQRIEVPVLVVHHEQDTCRYSHYNAVPALMTRFAAGRAELKTFSGGTSRGDLCEAFAHHGYNGIENEVVDTIADWIRKH